MKVLSCGLFLLLDFCICSPNKSFGQTDLEKAAKALQVFSDTLNKISNTNQQKPYNPQQNPYNQQQIVPQNNAPSRGPEGSNQNG